MNPDKMRHCMSLGYSEKSKLANTIGQCRNLSLTTSFVFCNLFLSSFAFF